MLSLCFHIVSLLRASIASDLESRMQATKAKLEGLSVCCPMKSARELEARKQELQQIRKSPHNCIHFGYKRARVGIRWQVQSATSVSHAV